MSRFKRVTLGLCSFILKETMVFLVASAGKSTHLIRSTSQMI